MTENKSTRLTPTAAALFPDLAGRPGELLRVEGGWAVVRFGEVVVRVKLECVENVEQKIGDQSAVSGLLGERGKSR